MFDPISYPDLVCVWCSSPCPLHGTRLAFGLHSVSPDLFEEGFAIFHRLIVLLDEEAPLRGAFAYALEWAWYLRLPMHAWALGPTLVSAIEPQKPSEKSTPASRMFPNPPSEEFARRVNACAKVCSDWSVEFRLTPVEGDFLAGCRQQLQPEDLLFISYAPSGSERLALIRPLLQESAAVLICPPVWKSTLSRMLVLYQGRESDQDALAAVLDLCRTVRGTPVVLTVARSQREAARLQQSARAAFAEHGQEGNFDLLIGSEVPEAAARVARWRQCQLLVIGRYGRASWVRWFGGNTTEQLIGLADSLAVLAVPPRRSSAVHTDSITARGALREIFHLGHSSPAQGRALGRSQ